MFEGDSFQISEHKGVYLIRIYKKWRIWKYLGIEEDEFKRILKEKFKFEELSKYYVKYNKDLKKLLDECIQMMEFFKNYKPSSPEE